MYKFNYNGTISQYDKILVINSKDVNAIICKGYALKALCRYDNATECFDKALEIDPKNTTALIGRESIIEIPGWK